MGHFCTFMFSNRPSFILFSSVRAMCEYDIPHERDELGQMIRLGRYSKNFFQTDAMTHSP